MQSDDVCYGYPGLLQHEAMHAQCRTFLAENSMDGWMNGVLGHFYALSRLNWAGDNLG